VEWKKELDGQQAILCFWAYAEEQNPMDTDFGMNMCVIVISCLSAALADIV